MSSGKAWVVRSGQGSEIIQTVESRGIVAIGWREMGDCSALAGRDDFRARYVEAYPDAHSIGGQTGQIYRFVREIQVGDTVLSPDSGAREVLVGEVTGEYRYAPEPTAGVYPQTRQVRWRGRIARDNMSQQFRASMGNLKTVFTVDGYLEEIERLLAGQLSVEPADEEANGESYDFLGETEAKSAELISDRLAGIPWDHFEMLVAAVIRGLGYRTKLTRRGADGGYDIVAHPDALGFEEPRIKAEVKHRKAAMGAPEVRSFRSTIGPNEKGLYVSTGGFTSDALREPEKAGAPLVLMDRDQFVELLLEHYEALEPEFKAMLPLKRVYIPMEI